MPSLSSMRTVIHRIALLLLGLILGGCNIADSTIVDLNVQTPPGVVTCSSALGSYALPKAFIRVAVGQPVGEKTARPQLVTFKEIPAGGKFEFDIVRRPDPALTVCLDHLSSAFAADEIAVTKYDPDDQTKLATRSKQFLSSVIVNASDKSVQIARNLIRAAFIAISRNPGFTLPDRDTPLAPADAHILADLEFDPFDVRGTAVANARLSTLGFCLVLEGFTYDRSSLSVDQYCNSPYRVRDHLPYVGELYAAKSREPIPPHTPGVLYRPRQAFLMSVYRRAGPGGRGSWTLSRRVSVNLENLSPVISVGVSRAVFARRRAALLFDQGTLMTACSVKTSELENFVAIPFEVARSIVALPAQIVTIRINRIQQRAELARVEQLFIETQAAAIKAQAEGAFEPGSSVPKTQNVALNNTFPADLNKSIVAEDADVFTFDQGTTQLIQKICGEDFKLNVQ